MKNRGKIGEAVIGS